MRLPLWYFEIDWFRTNIGIIKVDEIEKRLINNGQFTADDIANRKDCITIFNNPEGSRMDMPELISKVLDNNGNIGTFPIHEYWLDIGRKNDFDRAQSELKIYFEN